MFDIVLGATARRDMAEVQLFVHYLNLNRQADTHEQGEWGDRGEKKETKEGMTSRQIRAAEKSRSDGSLINRKKWPWSVCMEDIFSVNSTSPPINDCSALCDTGWEHGTVGKGWGNYATALLWLKTVGAANKERLEKETSVNKERDWVTTESFHKQHYPELIKHRTNAGKGDKAHAGQYPTGHSVILFLLAVLWKDSSAHGQ